MILFIINSKNQLNFKNNDGSLITTAILRLKSKLKLIILLAALEYL